MDVHRWIVAGLFFLACVFTPASQAGVSSADPTISSPQTERVLAYGLHAINDRYLTRVIIGNVAFEGMRGLGTIDPSVSVERLPNRHVLLRYRDDRVADFSAPGDNDVEGWADLIVRAGRYAAAHSSALQSANREKFYEAVFDAALSKLDIFSRYAGAREAAEHQAARNGFGGIGVRFELHPEDIHLTEVMPGTPAAEGHLAVGDHITAIDGTPLAGLSQDTISQRLRGPVGSSIALSVVKKPSAPASQVTLKRSLIVPPTVSMTMKDGIAVIAISSFNSKTGASTAAELKKAKTGNALKGVILDLRGNPGGLLDQGVAVADLFIAHGPIVSARGRHPDSVQAYEAQPGDPGEDVPVVVLVDGGTASAAEIVASALQDAGRAVLVGTNSYGKGTVQTVKALPNKGELTLTWSRFHSPSGYALHGLGVLPTICTADEKASVASLLAPLREGHSAVIANIAMWRASSIEDQDGRRQLRSVCPAAKQTDLTLDVEVGRDLLADHQLFAHTLALTASQSTASTASPHLPVKQH
ncbi:S41 family peptidase [Telmatospirillum sp.]|uniref:S41 family peptidase n=1 Tax=Telmatospirillum sp. TaxID=2079197 RepID=UPI00284FA8A9|nr:S41 family peptidase [Telmatospirillum sp.]MDR3441365.1 S41 family peptidase [Telmatospirillum sp.]